MTSRASRWRCWDHLHIYTFWCELSLFSCAGHLNELHYSPWTTSIKSIYLHCTTSMEVVSIVLHQWKLSALYYINGSCQYCTISMEAVSIVLHQWKLSVLSYINGRYHYIVRHKCKLALLYFINGSNHYCTTSMEAIIIVLHQWKLSVLYYMNWSYHYCTTSIKVIVAHATWHHSSCHSQEQQQLLAALRATF